MKFLNTIVVASLILLSTHTATLANNTIMTAKKLLQVCTIPDMQWVSFCNGFFQAVHDQQASLGKVCIPAGTTRTNLVEAYETHAAAIIASNIENAEELAVVVATEILVKKFPCR